MDGSGDAAAELRKLARHDRQNRRLDRAGERLRRALAVDCGTAEAYHQIATLLHELGHLDAAEAAAKRAIHIEPTHAAATALLGGFCLARRAVRKAEALFREAIGLNPNLGMAFRGLAAILKAENRFDAEIAVEQDAVGRDPTDRAAHRRLAVLLDARGRVADAVGHWAAARGLFPGDLARHGDLAGLFRRFQTMDIAEGMTRQDVIVLDALAQRAAVDGCSFVEIGSWLGMSTAVLGTIAAGCGGRVYAIDTWRGSVGTWQDGLAPNREILPRFCANMDRFGFLEETVVPIVSRSDRCDGLFAPGSVDLLFIDGDHRYPAILDDLRRWLPKVRPGGFVCGHDCERRYTDLTPDERARVDAAIDVDYLPGIGHPGVIRAVHEVLGERAMLAGDGASVWWARQTG